MNDYRDYVIKDGKFVGRFEEMYRDCEDPWEQTTDVTNNYSKMATVASVQRFGFKQVLEIGCGLGYFTNFLRNVLPDSHIIGMDISDTAIVRAKESFPDEEFIVGDIADPRIVDIWGGCDALLFTEIMWYILNDLDSIIARLKTYFAGGHIMINQTFYPENQQKYGREYFTTPDEMINYFDMPLVEMVNAHNIVGCHSSHVVLKVE